METGGAEQVIFSGHPSWRAMLTFHLKGVIWAILAGVIAGLLTAAASGHVSAAWVVLAVFLVFVAALSSGLMTRRRTTYTITNRRLTIEVGLVARDVHETRLELVQNVSCRQSALERLLGVGTVAFDTASSAGFDFAFRGVYDPRRLARTVGEALHTRAVVQR